MRAALGLLKYREAKFKSAKGMEDVIEIFQVLSFFFFFFFFFFFSDLKISLFQDPNDDIEEEQFFSYVSLFKGVTGEKIEKRRQECRPVVLENAEEEVCSFYIDKDREKKLTIFFFFVLGWFCLSFC